MPVVNPLLAGTATVTVNGTAYQLEGNCTYSPSKVKRETLTGQDGVHGFKETPVPGSIGGSFRDSGGLAVADFNAMRDATVVLQLASGKQVIGRNMWTVDAQEIKTDEGTFDVKWEGPLVEEVVQ